LDKKTPTAYVASAALVVFASALGTSSEPVAAGQEAIVIPDEVSCPQCEIKVSRVATLGSESEPSPGFVCQYWTRVAANSRGQFYVAPTCTGGEIDVYSAEGEWLETFGRLGEAPGEFAHILQIHVGPDDYVYVFDTSHRLKVLTPDHEEHKRAGAVFKPPSAFAAGRVDERAVVQVEIRTESRIGYPLHSLEPNGSLSRSFGTIRRAFLPSSSWRSVRRMIAINNDGLVWSSKSQPDDYQIELWDPADGSLRLTLLRQVDWYKGEATAGAVTQGLHVDGDGLLWSLVAMAPKQWEWGDQNRTPEEINEDRFSIIEVINPVTGQLVAQRRLETVFERFIGQQMMYSFRGIPDGNNVIDVWRFELVNPDQLNNKGAMR